MECIVFLVVLQVLSQLTPTVSYSTVEFLPGFQGSLPFELETGYIGVDISEDVQLFYYFVKSQENAKEDPLLLWLTGGPGCSALSGLIYEIGPLNFKIEEYNGSLPTLVLNPHSWTQVANILFVDMPVGTGFSYARTPLASHSNDFLQVRQADEFLRKWLKAHPEFLSNQIYIAGDSYSGIIVPALVQYISNGNEESIKPLINLKGYALGNPITDPVLELNMKIPFSHGMALISDELYESLMSSCGGQYVNIDPGNAECLKNMQDYHDCTSGIKSGQILEPNCEEDFGKRRFLNQDYLLDFDPPVPEIKCRSYGRLLSKYWARDNSVQKALHVREGTVEKWKRCNYDIPYSYGINSSINYHISLAKKPYRSLIYSGDHDMLVPFLSTQAWIRSLNYSIVDDWRPWLLEGQIAGYTRSYSNRMTFATVKGGGHTAPEYKPTECFAMFKRWIHHQPL